MWRMLTLFLWAVTGEPQVRWPAGFAAVVWCGLVVEIIALGQFGSWTSFRS